MGDPTVSREHEGATVISRGQVWKNRDTGNHVTVADFAEYTAGWFVRVKERDNLIHELRFRAEYELTDPTKGACQAFVWQHGGWHRVQCSREGKRQVGDEWLCEQHAKKAERLEAIRRG